MKKPLQNMRIFVVSKGERFHTFAWLNKLGLDYTAVCHTAEQAAQLRSHVAGRRVVATGLPDLLAQRRWVLGKVRTGEWYVGADDNIRAMTELPQPWRDQLRLDIIGTRPAPGVSWAKAFNHEVDAERLSALLAMVVQRCEQLGTVYGGFAPANVALYRASQWSDRRFVKSKLFVMKAGQGVQWDGGGNVAHDSWMSVYCAHRFGAAPTYNYAHPVHKMYEGGGIGSLEERKERLEVECERIITQFPGMVRRASGPNAALAFIGRRKQTK